jgi:hypothetical protein
MFGCQQVSGLTNTDVTGVVVRGRRHSTFNVEVPYPAEKVT